MKNRMLAITALLVVGVGALGLQSSILAQSADETTEPQLAGVWQLVSSSFEGDRWIPPEYSGLMIVYPPYMARTYSRDRLLPPNPESVSYHSNVGRYLVSDGEIRIEVQQSSDAFLVGTIFVSTLELSLDGRQLTMRNSAAPFEEVWARMDSP